ncbi:MAG: bifunctional nuclease family protein [Planctomycetes bacterium]|nr:bifunctional nuclease family protein [Planctomycetota bacterium]
MSLHQIVIHEHSDQQFIFLKEEGGKRRFPIVIGIFEATVIDRKVRNFKPPRPMTHDLLVNVIESLGGEVQHVVVNKLEDNTFYAKLVVRQDGRVVEIDSRPSDAIAVASHTKVPIYVEEQVLDEVARADEA